MNINSILYSIYTGEYPNQFAGGPNNIIYKILNSSNSTNYKFDYLSSDIFVEEINRINSNRVKEKRSVKKKTASYLFQNSELYQRFCTSDFYLPIHFAKKNIYYKSFQNRISRYDIIHSQDSISLGLICNQQDKSKKILTIHSKGALSDELRNMTDNPNLSKRIDQKLKAIEIKSLERADIITFPSKAARNYFEESMRLRIDDKKVKIIYNGIDTNHIDSIINDNDILQKYSIEKKKNSLLFLNVAAHTREKNIAIILEVINILKYKYKKDVFLINVGQGNLNQNLVPLSKKLQIENNVKFLGKIENQDVIKLLKVSDVFFMASEKVIFDLIVLEALACGACCVISDEGGNKEIIKDSENGYLIDIKDTDGIAKKIISVDLNKVKIKAKETANKFSVKKMVNEYFELYENLINGV